jgi:YD repeat-containing protein
LNEVTRNLWRDVMRPQVRFRYIYDKQGRLRGAIATDGLRVGYSYACKQDIAKCSKKLARHIALGRMLTCKLERDEQGYLVRVRNERAYYIPREVTSLLEAYGLSPEFSSFMEEL